MTIASLIKPGTLASPVLGGGKIGTTGTSFYLKVINGVWDWHSPTQETTGDGDDAPRFENSGLLYASFNLQGAMVSAGALGVENIIASANNPSASFTFSLASGRVITATVQVERLRTNWGRRGVFVGVAMIGMATNVTPVLT